MILYLFNRDIKLENIIMTKKEGSEIEIKLIDFGCATESKPDKILDRCCGSIFYIAPEVWLNHYNIKCDVWSLGIVAFSLLTARFPFDDN